jgi:hypothetical protein
VGAAISTWRPAWIAGHASAWAGVGALKLRSNQAATAGWNWDVAFISPVNLADGGASVQSGNGPLSRGS